MIFVTFGELLWLAATAMTEPVEAIAFLIRGDKRAIPFIEIALSDSTFRYFMGLNGYGRVWDQQRQSLPPHLIGHLKRN